jgi:hypothetical protein
MLWPLSLIYLVPSQASSIYPRYSSSNVLEQHSSYLYSKHRTTTYASTVRQIQPFCTMDLL